MRTDKEQWMERAYRIADENWRKSEKTDAINIMLALFQIENQLQIQTGIDSILRKFDHQTNVTDKLYAIDRGITQIHHNIQYNSAPSNMDEQNDTDE